MYSDPMPGENYENAAEREKARAEREAIANGENFNPNLSEEAAEGFANLESEVPFAGDAPASTDIAMAAAELTVENPATVAAGVATAEGINLVSDLAMESVEGQSYDDMEEQNQKHDSDNAIGQKFDEQWDQGKTPDLDDIQESVERDYIDGAIEQSVANPDAAADLAEAERDASDHPDNEEQPAGDQPHDIAEAAAAQAISAAALSEELAEDIKTGDEDAIARMSEVTQRAAEATETASKVAYATANNSENDIEARMATDVAAQAQEKAMEAIDTIETAKAEYDSMSEEEKEETKIAAEAAKQNGTTVEEEKAKIEEEEEEDDFKPDLSRGIFG